MTTATTQAIGWALVHFVWQGALVALLAGLASAALRRARPEARYALFCGALALLALLPLVTFLAVSATPPALRTFAAPVAASAATVATSLAVPAEPEPDWLRWLVTAWLCGMSVLAVRSLGGFALAQRMKRWKTSPAAESIQRAGATLCSRMGVRRSVSILNSAMAEVPAAIGWLRPVVLLPIRFVTTLTPEQIELLVAHELAHVRRHDYLVNLLQTAVETVLFYHPAVWWVSSQIRAEREHCCDDLAVKACGDPVVYARTLATLEGLRSTRTPLAVAADGGSLLERIRRLLHGDGVRRTSPPAWAGALLPIALVAVAMVSVAPPEVEAGAPAKPAAAEGFLGGLAAVGYTDLTIDEVIALKEHGVAPGDVGGLMAAGLGTPSVRQVIELHDHGVDAEYVAGVVRTGLVSDLSFESSIRLHEHGVDTGDLTRIRALGFGPFTTREVVELHDRGVGPSSFEALAEAGFGRAGASEAIEFHDNDITADRIRSMKRQGFANLSLEQIVKLRRGGII